MRMLGHAGLVPTLRFSTPGRLTPPRRRRWRVKRHLLVTNDFPPKVGGIQNYLWDLWSRLDPDSFVVLTASSDRDAAAFDAAQAARGVRIERVPGSILFFPTPQARRAVADCVEAHGIDLVLLDPALPLGLLGPRLGVPYGVILHGAEVTVPGRLPGARAALGRVLRGSSIVLSAGGYPAAEARRGRAGPHGAGGRDPPRRRHRRRRPAQGARTPRRRTRLGLPATGPLLVSVSRLVPRKGMDVLIEAADRLAPSYPDLVVAIAGDGRERPTPRAPGRREPGRRAGARPGQRRGPGRPPRLRPTSSSWPAATGGWASSKRGSASCSSRRRPPACPRSPGTAAAPPRRCSTG